MGSMFNKVADPANVFGFEEGGFDLRGAMDPGGTILKATTGSDIGLKVADPGKYMEPGGSFSSRAKPQAPITQTKPETILTTADRRKKRIMAELKRKNQTLEGPLETEIRGF